MSAGGPRTSEACREPEQLAAFVDGRLEGAERRQMIEHLEGCPDCYEQVAEIAAFVEHEREPAGGVKPRRRSGRWTRIVLPLAAMLLVAFGIALWTGPRQPALGVATLAESIGTPGGDWQTHGWAVTRGGVVTAADRDRAFRLGVLAVDLEVALRSGDRDASVRLAARMLELVESQAGAEAAALVYARLRERGAAAADTGELLELTASADELLAEVVEPTYYALGKWSEAARLSVLSDGALLASRDFRRSFARLDRAPLSDADRRAVDEIAAALDEGRPASRVRRSLEALIDAH